MARERGRGQIIPWADGSFHLRWYSHVEDGRRKYAGKRVVGTRQDAEAELARVLAERAAERAGGGDASPRLKGETLSLSELVDRWLLSLEVGGTGARTREGYVHELAGLLRAMGALRAGRITRTMIERHLMELEREGRSRRTRAGLVVLLRSVFEYALAEALIWRSPVEHLKLARAARGTRRPQVLTPEQLRAFLQAAESDRHLAYWVLAVGTGARPGELAGLEWRHVDLERAEIRIEQALTIEGGKLVIGPTKTGKERTVPVAGTVVAALRAHRARQAKGALRSGLRGWNGHDLVFMGREAQPLNVNSMNSKTFKRIAKEAGLPEGLRAYCLRHSHASALLDAGEPPQRVAERLGHGVETLLRVYSHALAGREIQTAATAARVLFGE